MSNITTDRVQKLSIDPYDQVFALTEEMINAGLQSGWLEAYDDPNSGLAKEFACYMKGIGYIKKARIESPRMVLEASLSSEALQGALYMLCFESGVFELIYDVLDEEGNPVLDENEDIVTETKTWNMAGWRMAFNLQLGMTEVERSTDAYVRLLGPEVADGNGPLGQNIVAGEYSLNALVAKAETAIFNLGKSYFGGIDFTKEPEAVRDNIDTLMRKQRGKFVAEIQKSSNLGYAFKADETGNSAPGLLFTPHKLQYQTYPWVNPDAIGPTPTSGLTESSRLNCLLYLETTVTDELPTKELPTNERFLKFQGNFTDGRLEASFNSESSDFGSFHMTGRNFFNGYLLKKLRVLNRALEPSMSWVYVKIDNWYKPWVKFDADLKVGENPMRSKDDKFYDFVQDSPTSWKFESYYGDTSNLKSGDEAGNVGWAGKVFGKGSCSARNTVSFEPGSDTITVEGLTKIAFHFQVLDTSLFGKGERNSHLEYHIKWKMILDLEAVKNGGLQIKSTFETPTVIPVQATLTDLEEYKDFTLNSIRTAINNMDDLRKALAEDLQGKQGLCLPAAGVFYFKNPILGHKGDLICSISYNKTPARKVFNPKSSEIVLNKEGKDQEKIAGGNRTPLPTFPGPKKWKVNK
ncbi:hypothetical protein N7490_003299 [Penicillium lividum]|nr:hypothetical protein N7490_003299 [Penicillium lividum]